MLTVDAVSGLRDSVAVVSEVAARHVKTCEDEFRLAPEVAEALTQAGFPRQFVPKRWGGRAGGFGELVQSVADLGESCASAAWCAALFAAHGRLASYLPEQAQYALWADGPDTRIAAAVIPPAGTAEPAADAGSEVGGGVGGTAAGVAAQAGAAGWRLSGRWNLASGVDHADWILLASWTPCPSGPEHRIFLLPRASCTVLDTWRSSGLRGTGSNSVVVDRVFVPAHRTMVLADLLRPRTSVDGEEVARCHQVPFPMVAALIFAAPVLGAAGGALDAWSAALRAKAAAGGPGPSPAVQQTLARAGGEIHAAELLLTQSARSADGGPMDAYTVTGIQRDVALAVELLVDAVERIFRAGGTSTQTQLNPIQVRWRDVHAAASHGTLNFEAAASRYAAVRFPVEADSTG
ncbi:oxidoreductase [Streptacidiphilus sp. N1-12]|uniref:Oxidoreductase n=2 Tax=Streptacidiphilus alkalitolerans TaxID=3342712 RepID=A0ABV6WFV9_9ACTN